MFNALTYRTLGAPGLALGTTVAAIVNVSVLRVAFGRLVGGGPAPGRAREWLSLLVANAVLAAVAYGGWRGAEALLPTLNEHLPRAGQRLAMGALLFAVIGVGFLTYVRVLGALRYPGADELATLPRKLLARFGGRRKGRA
jgi:putative peptidoglycan lipid II flippase